MGENGSHIRHHVEHMVNIATERRCTKNNITPHCAVNIFYEEIVSIYSKTVFISPSSQ